MNCSSLEYRGDVFENQRQDGSKVFEKGHDVPTLIVHMFIYQYFLVNLFVEKFQNIK